MPFERPGECGEDYFAPGWTQYRKRVQYQVYDVTDLLLEGENAWGAVLGDGWYCGHVEARPRQQYGDRPRFLGQIQIEFADGQTEWVTTDASWRTAFGPLLESDLIMGEAYDARRALPGWDNVGFDDNRWQPVEIFPDPKTVLTAMPGPAVGRFEELRPVGEPKEYPVLAAGEMGL